MITGPGAVTVISHRLKDAVADALGDTGAPVERAVVTTGAIAWDGCDCGMLTIATVRQFVTDEFPSAEMRPTLPCKSGFRAWELLITVMRCAPQPKGTKLYPDVAELDETGALVESDAFVLMDTVNCTLADMYEDDDIVDYQMQPVSYVGAQGSCIGTEVRVLVSTEW